MATFDAPSSVFVEQAVVPKRLLDEAFQHFHELKRLLLTTDYRDINADVRVCKLRGVLEEVVPGKPVKQLCDGPSEREWQVCAFTIQPLF